MKNWGPPHLEVGSTGLRLDSPAGLLLQLASTLKALEMAAKVLHQAGHLRIAMLIDLLREEKNSININFFVRISRGHS